MTLERLEKVVISQDFITGVEKKLDDYSRYLLKLNEKDLKNLLDFLFYYVVEKPNTNPRKTTIIKKFDLDQNNEILIDDIRTFLYAIRLMLQISINKQDIERFHEL